ncbi:actin binding protein [Pelomyxa schiedti]|nr:actin binding protein [Pelomyxa schiedti]
MDAVFVDEAEVKAAIKQVRLDNGPINWVAVTYEGARSTKLKLHGSGSEGVDEFAATLADELAVFGLVRLVDKIDESLTVKFAFISFTGDSMPRMQKAKVSIHRAGIMAAFGQSHVQLSVTNKSELSNQVVLQKVMETSGSASRVINRETGQKETVSSTATAAAAHSKKEDYSIMQWEDLGNVKATLKQVRAHTDPLTWALVTYSENSLQSLKLLGSGTGTIDAEVVPLLRDDIVVYGLVRRTEIIDESETTKFVYINWVGENTPRQLKTRLSAHQGVIRTEFEPHHVLLNCTRLSEISDAEVDAIISKASGTASHVLTETIHTERVQKSSGTAQASTPAQQSTPVTEAPKPARTTQRTTAPRTTASTASTTTPSTNKDSLILTDEPAIRAAIQSVRSDSDPTTWALVSFVKGKNNTIQLLGTGTSDTAELVSQLADDAVVYGLLRRTLRVDESDTVKFVFIDWCGNNIGRMLRARLPVFSGEIKALFSPYHVDLHPTEHHEITEEIVMTAIATAAGSKSNVL